MKITQTQIIKLVLHQTSLNSKKKKKSNVSLNTTNPLFSCVAKINKKSLKEKNFKTLRTPCHTWKLCYYPLKILMELKTQKN